MEPMIKAMLDNNNREESLSPAAKMLLATNGENSHDPDPSSGLNNSLNCSKNNYNT